MRNRIWDPASGRDGLEFYEATNEYMRNAWAFDYMDHEVFDVGGQTVVLFHYEPFDTWHTIDAFDIDHITPVQDHLDRTLSVGNMADALDGYNDVDNLRLIPAPYNRGRAHVDGLDATQRQNWIDRKFGFDADPDRPVELYDPDAHATDRTTSLRTPWRPEDGRSGLDFDRNVRGVWFQEQLARMHAADLEFVHDGAPRRVPIFLDPVSGQYVTRDAFVIDHQRPIAEVLDAEYRRRREEGGPFANGAFFSRADAWDLYNDIGNLRLVGSSANASHEFERNADGGYASDDDADDRDLQDFIEFDDSALPESVRNWIRRRYDRTAPAPRDPDADDVVVHEVAVTRRTGPIAWLRIDDVEHPDYETFIRTTDHFRNYLLAHGTPYPNERFVRQAAAHIVAEAAEGGLGRVNRLQWDCASGALAAIEDDDFGRPIRSIAIDPGAAMRADVADSSWRWLNHRQRASADDVPGPMDVDLPERAGPLRLDDRAHPGHALFNEMLSEVRERSREFRLDVDEDTARNIASTLATDFVRAGHGNFSELLLRVDEARGTLVFAAVYFDANDDRDLFEIDFDRARSSTVADNAMRWPDAAPSAVEEAPAAPRIGGR
ncbi:MAG: hypothetical protein ACOY82_07655 [Pseudomonadota bacterium]